MKISDKFTDYPLIGGFFWALQVVWVVKFGDVRSIWREFGKAADQIPSGVVSPLAALLGAVALIAIFATGLLLDLLGREIFRPVEMLPFHKHARFNDPWMKKLVSQHQDYIQNDWELSIEKPRLTSFRTYLVYPRRVSAYTRVQSFLLAYVALSPQADKLDLLSRQISLCNTSRAISAAVLLAVPAGRLYANVQPLHWVIYAVMLLICVLITIIANSRLSSITFALAYIASEGSTNPIKAAAAL